MVTEDIGDLRKEAVRIQVETEFAQEALLNLRVDRVVLIRRLRKAGLSYNSIGKIMGINGRNVAMLYSRPPVYMRKYDALHEEEREVLA
jgi:hypothetical protein